MCVHNMIDSWWSTQSQIVAETEEEDEKKTLL